MSVDQIGSGRTERPVPVAVATLDGAPRFGHRRPDDAARALELQATVRAKPDEARTWYDLGCTLNRLNRPVEALDALECALTLVPEQIDAVCERGTALTALGRLGAAAEMFEDVLASHPLHGRARFCLGNVRYRQGRLEEAAALWHGAAGLIDDPVEALENVAVACQRLALPAEEKAVWSEIVAHRPDHAVALHKLAAFGLRPVPTRASDACVRFTFDEFSEEFDATLDALHYAGPRIVEGLLHEVLGAPAAVLDVLDGGCGTGLCGSVLRPWSRRLTGVDLSSGMLARARARGVHDEFVQAELTDYLRRNPGAFDLIVSADVLVYFGRLDEVLEAAAGALRRGGWCCFTLEKLAPESGGEPCRLEPHGRYTHSGSYVESVLREAGFDVGHMGTEVIRYESGQPVDGWIVAAHRERESP